MPPKSTTLVRVRRSGLDLWPRYGSRRGAGSTERARRRLPCSRKVKVGGRNPGRGTAGSATRGGDRDRLTATPLQDGCVGWPSRTVGLFVNLLRDDLMAL